MLDPGRYTYAEGDAEPAPLVPRHRRPQHRDRRRRSTRRRTRAARSSLPERRRRRSSAAPHPASTSSPARCAARSTRPSTGARIAFVDGATGSSRTGWTASAPPLRPALPPRARPGRGSRGTTCSRRASRLVILGARSVALEAGWVAPSYGDQARRAGRERGRRGARTLPALRRLPACLHGRRRRARGDRRPHATCSTAATRLAACSHPTPRAARRAARERLHGRRARAAGALRARCYVKYRVGDSLRVVYRFEPATGTSPAAPSAAAARASTAAPPRRPRRRPLPAVLHAAALEPCSGASPTTAGSPGCRCSTAARRARPARRSAGRAHAADGLRARARRDRRVPRRRRRRGAVREGPLGRGRARAR